MSIGERINTVRTSNKLTMETFGAKIGITRSSISLLESGKSNPSEQTIRSICREFGVSEAWLRDGEGEMLAYKSRDEELAEAVNRLLADESPEFRQRLVIGLSRLSDGQWDYLEDWLHTILDERVENTASRPAVPITTARNGQDIIRGMTRAEYHARLDRQLDAEQEEDLKRIQALPQSGRGVSGNDSPARGSASTGTGGGVA